MKPLVIAGLVGVLLPGTAAADIYRCQTEDGVAYQDTPCSGPGSLINLQVDRPSPAEVARTERRLTEMREMLAEAEKEQAEKEQAEAARKVAERPAAFVQRARDDGGEEFDRESIDSLAQPRTIRHRDKGPDRRAIDTCPLGLSNCKKVRERVFRRPKSGPIMPFEN